MITCDALAPVFLLGQAPADVTATATDGGSGPASQSLSAPADTSSVLGNPKSVLLNATDDVGNSSTKACSYSVVYDFGGFFPPVDNPGPGPSFVFNVAKAGSAIPVKFSLNGFQGLSVLASGYPGSQTIACNLSTVDAIEETVTAGSSSLSYDATTDRYTYVWKTDKAWASSCRKLTVRLNDGTDHVAYFNLKR